MPPCQTTKALEELLNNLGGTQDARYLVCATVRGDVLRGVAEKYRKMERALQEISNDYVDWQHDVGPKPDLEVVAEYAGEALAFDPLQS
jgi:hypothetical protein